MMTDAADFQTLFETAVSLNNMAVALQDKERYLLSHHTLKDAMACMQLILRPDQCHGWPSKMDMAYKINTATERLRLVQGQIGTVQVVSIGYNCDLQHRVVGNGPEGLSLTRPIPITYEQFDQIGIDINSSIIVFNFGLTYLGLGAHNCPSNRRILYEAAVELFYLSYSILVKLSVETQQLDFCEYILVLSMKMLRQTISVDLASGKDVAPLEKLLQNAEDSFSVLNRIGEGTVAAAA